MRTLAERDHSHGYPVVVPNLTDDMPQLIGHDRRIAGRSDIPPDNRLVKDVVLARPGVPAREFRLALQPEPDHGVDRGLLLDRDDGERPGVIRRLEQARHDAVLELPDED